MNDVSILTNNGVNVQSSLELLGDMEMYNETLSDFLDMVEEKKSNLEKFKAENDMPNYAIAIHALKSDARYLGFLELGDLAYDSELKAKAGDQAGVEANHANIMSHVDSMVNIANQYLGRSGGAPAQTTADPNAAMTSQAQNVMPQMQQAVPMPQNAQAMAPQANPMVGQQPMPGQMPGYASPMGAPAAQNTQNQIYDLSTGQMVADPNPQPMPAQQPMPNQMPGYGQQMGGYPNPMYNPYQQSMPGYQMPMYGQQQQPMPGQMPGYDPMSQALYQQQTMQQYQQAMPNPALMPKAGTILVVDDSNLVANFVKKIFESRYDVVIANDGAKAIELCDNAEFRQKIKACLLDLNMPNVDGFQVLEDFKQKGYIVRMPIVVISGAEDAASRDRANTYAIMGILSKPFNERDVQKAVEQCLAVYF